MNKLIKYPACAFKLSIDFNPFGFWWKPRLVIKRSLTEHAKVHGAIIWYFRWGWFQISRSRWV